MQTHTQKNTTNDSTAESREKRNPEQVSLFGENTSEAALQLKAAQDMADNSPQANQLAQLKEVAGNNSPVAQLKTEIKHTTGTVHANGADRLVGKGMTAKLDPDNPVKGSATGVNSYWMQWIRGQHTNANVVRGHLLNHDLGGFGIEENLYPISTKANADHSAKVEQKVKGELYNLNQKTKGENEGYVHYSVDVGENDSYKKAAFRCKWLVEYPLNTLSDEKEEVIVSDLGKDKGGFGGGKKSEKSPKDWQHGSSKGGKEVTSVKKRLDEAVDAGNITFTNKKSDDPEITNETDEQDMLEWLNDYVDEKGYDNAMSVLVKLEKKYAKMPKKSRLIRYVKRQLRSMGDD